jgi:hypothetical protein
MGNQTSRTRRIWWPALVIPAAACVFCWPVFLGRVMLPADMCLLMLPWSALAGEFPGFHRIYNPMFDPIQQYLPWRIYAVDALRSGLVPLWNPYAFCGTPFLANLQSTVLYPLNLLFLAAGARHGFGLSAILHLSLGGLFMFGFLRELRLARPAALLGALVLMFNGFTVTWLEFPALSLWVFMWLPAVLLCYERSLSRPRSIWPAFCAVVLGVQFCGGHLQVSAYVVMAFLLYAVVRAITGRGAGVGAGRAAALAVIPLALGLVLAAGQILPTLELAAHTGRVSRGAAGPLTTAFPVSHLIIYFIPNFFGNPVHYNYWGNFQDPAAFNFFETAAYVGILPLFLAVWSLRRWREASVQFLLILVAFAILAAVGSPLYLVLHYLVPGFRELAGLGRILCLAAFGLAGLAAVGTDDLLSRAAPSRPTRAPLGFLALASICIAAAYMMFQPAVAEMGPPFGRYLLLQAVAFAALSLASVGLIQARTRLRLSGSAFAWVAVSIVAIDLFGFGIRFNPFVEAGMAYPETETTGWLQERAGHQRVTSLVSGPMSLDWMPHNSPMIFGLRDIHGSDSLRVRRSFELVAGPKLDQANYPTPDSPLLDALGVRYLVTERAVGDGWRLAHDAEAPIYENLEALPRAYVLEDGRGAGAGVGAARFEVDEPDQIVLRAEGEAAGRLALMDSYYPGWRAWVDGKPVVIQDFRRGFRAVALPPGEHTVELRYEPASFRVGVFASLLALALLIGCAAALSISGRRS